MAHHRLSDADETLDLDRWLRDGASFQARGLADVQAARHAGIPPERLMFWQPIARAHDLAAAARAGVRLVMVERRADLLRMATEAPQASAVCRWWPRGTQRLGGLELALDLFGVAAELEIDLAGMSVDLAGPTTSALVEAMHLARPLLQAQHASGGRPWLLHLTGVTADTEAPGHELTSSLWPDALSHAALRVHHASAGPQVWVERCLLTRPGRA